MNWKTIFPIAISLMIAFVGSFLIYQYIAEKRTPIEIVKMEKTDSMPVVVPAIDLPLGTKITAEMVKTTPYLKESLPPAYFDSPAKLTGRVVLTSLKANEPISEYKLAPKSVKTGGVSAILSEGKRAIAVKGDKVVGISGFIYPGNRVDVIVTVKDPRTKKDTSKIFLENLLVLATGKQIQKNEKGEPMPVDVYTLEVNPDQAERLTLAATKGKLQFALRGTTDSTDIWTKGITIPDLLENSKWSEVSTENTQKVNSSNSCEDGSVIKTAKKRTKKRIWRRRSSTTVEIIKGLKIQKKKFSL